MMERPRTDSSVKKLASQYLVFCFPGWGSPAPAWEAHRHCVRNAASWAPRSHPGENPGGQGREAAFPQPPQGDLCEV